MKSLHKLQFFLLGTLVLLFSTPAEGYETNENKKVAKITIFLMKDKEKVEAPQLLSKLKTQVGKEFNAIALDEDLKALSKEYDRIEPEVTKSTDEVFITITLWTRPLIKKITFHGNHQFKTTTVKHEFGMTENTILLKDTLIQALHKIKAYYIKRGFFESQITYEVKPYKDSMDEVELIVRIKEGRSCKINDIIFIGFANEEEKALRGLLITKNYNVFLSWLTGEGKYQEDALEQDQLTVLNFLHDRGYADAKAEIKMREGKKSNGVVIEIIADKGRIYTVGKIVIEGNKLITTDKIQSHLEIHSQDIFSPEKIRQSAQAIKELYGMKGYIEAEVNFDMTLKESEPTYDIIFHITEGEAYRIGMIRIFGNTHTRANVILRESLLIPGEKFDSRRLKATQMRLQNIGYFKSVNVYAVRSRDDFSLGANYRDIHIEVEEDSTANASASIGLSSLEDVFGVVQITERNFNIAGIAHPRTEGLRGAGEYAHIKGTVGKREQAVLVSWMTPYLHDSLWRLGVELSYTRSQLQSSDYKINTYGGSVFTSYPLTNYWTYGMRYRVRNLDIHLDKEVDKPSHDKHHDDTEKTNETRDDSKKHGIISAFSTSLSFDSTDNARKAHRGIRSTLEAEFAGAGGSVFFLKLDFLNAVYFPIWSKGTVKFRGEMRFIEPILGMTKDTLPLSERFFLGGDTTVRGYKSYILGPRFPSKNDPTGGISSTLLSLEYSQFLHSMADIFIFIDAGTVSQGHFAIPKFNGSYGIGLRLDLLHRLPLEGGLCLPINPDRKDDFHYYFFSMTGTF